MNSVDRLLDNVLRRAIGSLPAARRRARSGGDGPQDEGRRAIITELQRRIDQGTLSSDSVAESLQRGTVTTEPFGPDGVLLRRVWRGDVSLARTFWIGGIGMQLCLRALMVLALSLPPGLRTIVELVLFVVYLALLGFLCIAVWRSAGHYQGASIWRYLARLWVVLIPVLILLSVLAR